MNPAHAHLILNHIPVVGAFFCLLLIAYGVIRKSDEVKKLSFGIFILIALLTIPAYLTGEPAEGRVHELPDVAKGMIEEHEESALVSFIGIEVLGALGLLGLVFSVKTKAIPTWLAIVSLIVSLVVCGLMSWTANLGGQIRHSEIRGDAGGTGVTPTESEDR